VFPIAYEGPPGVVHGGFLAVFFDCVVQHHNCEVGLAGKTVALTVRYRRPTPLLTPLGFTLERVVEDDSIHTSGALSAGGKVVCEAEVDAIAGVRGNLPEVSPRRAPT
jgi:acyl-coenzyme A thioesterase PaaI-like protein